MLVEGLYQIESTSCRSCMWSRKRLYAAKSISMSFAAGLYISYFSRFFFFLAIGLFYLDFGTLGFVGLLLTV